jgi:hypothetical protein
MKSKPTQEELQAATNADEAKALVARLATMVDEYALCARHSYEQTE